MHQYALTNMSDILQVVVRISFQGITNRRCHQNANLLLQCSILARNHVFSTPSDRALHELGFCPFAQLSLLAFIICLTSNLSGPHEASDTLIRLEMKAQELPCRFPRRYSEETDFVANGSGSVCPFNLIYQIK